jgi:hypothetical protein
MVILLIYFSIFPSGKPHFSTKSPGKRHWNGIGKHGMANNPVVECAESLCPQREGIE